MAAAGKFEQLYFKTQNPEYLLAKAKCLKGAGDSDWHEILTNLGENPDMPEEIRAEAP